MSETPYITELLREYFQDQRINKTRSRLGDVKHHQENLQDEVARLHLVVEALWEILRKHHGLSNQALLQAMHEIDQRDGRLDGKSLRSEISICPGCGKVLEKGVPTCMHCGLLHKVSPFEHR